MSTLVRRVRRRLAATRSGIRDGLGRPPREPLARAIFELAQARPDASFVQIGSHDASQLDPLRRYILEKRWRGILVEPVPEVFERLVANYAGRDGLIFENAAIGTREGTMDLHYLPQTDEEGLPQWYDALASFDRDVLLSHRTFIPDIEDRIRTMAVPTLTFDGLLAKHSVERVDFVQIDTEGYDLQILRTIDLERHRPLMLQIEELHLDEADRRSCAELLSEHGYQAIGNTMDLLAFHPASAQAGDRRVVRTWRRSHADPSLLRA